MLVALALDALIGWPPRLHARIGHPVTWVGGLVDALDSSLNRPAWPPRVRRLAGVGAALTVIGLAAVVAAILARLLPGEAWGAVLTGILAWPLVAARSLHEHVAAVALQLTRRDLPAARVAVSRIVGRDPAPLDEAGVARATLESLAENASDGVVAPLFWGVLLGLPGIAAYKALNTLDSMIGHRSPRYEAFGWASARLDDVANLVPARLTALLLALVWGRRGGAFATMRSDARRHRSPNAGWPEAAMAAALGVRLSGPRAYADQVAAEPWVNAGALDPTPEDLKRALALFRRAMFVLAAALAVLAAL
jgi:adenosylcobinamide-phosphate synthase